MRKLVLLAVVKTATSLASIRLTSGGSGVSDGCSNVAGESLPLPNTSAEDDATRKPRRSIFIVDGFEIMEICREFPTLSRTLCNTDEYLLRDHPDRLQPRLHQLGPCSRRKLCASEPERMPALRVQMHLHRNPGLLQRGIITQRVLYAVHMVVLVLQQERSRCLAGDVSANIRIQRNTIVSQRQMSGIERHRKVGTGNFFFGRTKPPIHTSSA